MKLAQFIREHKKEITNEWVKYAQENIKGVSKLQLEEVRDHIKQMLDRVVESMETAETDSEQEKKSKGNQEINSGNSKAANQHGEQRADVGFSIMDLSSEFRALRASILRLWEASRESEKLETDLQEIIRFNEAIDELWLISMKRFDQKIDESKNWFMGILGHDLRTPLTSISGVNSILKMSRNISEKERSLLRRSESSVKRMMELINNLLELTNLRLGSGLTINSSPVDLSKQSEKIVQEMQLGYPKTEFILETPGPVEGAWDPIRLGQLITNLITNAVRHGEPGGPVTVTISAKDNEAFFMVHNPGPPVPRPIQEMIATGNFTRTNGDPGKRDSYGLGLYIVKEIVNGHKGKIELSSDEEAGTTFRVMLPRQ